MREEENEWAAIQPNRRAGRRTEGSKSSLRFWRGVSSTGGVMADWDGITERERRQMEEILQLDMEELNVEVVEDDDEEEEEEEEEEQGDGDEDEDEDDVDAFLR